MKKAKKLYLIRDPKLGYFTTSSLKEAKQYQEEGKAKVIRTIRPTPAA